MLLSTERSAPASEISPVADSQTGRHRGGNLSALIPASHALSEAFKNLDSPLRRHWAGPLVGYRFFAMECIFRPREEALFLRFVGEAGPTAHEVAQTAGRSYRREGAAGSGNVVPVPLLHDRIPTLSRSHLCDAIHHPNRCGLGK